MSMGVSVSDLWHGMVSRKSHVSKLKNWMPMHSKNKKKPSVRPELRAAGDPISLRSQGGVPVTQGSGLKKEMPIHPVSPKGVLLLGFLICSKSAK